MSTNTTGNTEATAEESVIIQAEEVTKSYRTFDPMPSANEVLTGVDIELTSSDIIGIVGENGSGKSTLMKILVGILDHDDGTVIRNGTTGWSPQEKLLYDRLTVSETFNLFGKGYGMTSSAVDDAQSRLADRLDFEEYLDYRIENLSGGTEQKINLGIGLMHDPDILLLDEPYTGFDWDTYLAFWEMAEEIVDHGTGIAIISHLVNEQERFDHIYELSDGTLQEDHADDE